MLKLITLLLSLISFSSFAEKVSFGVGDLKGDIVSSDFKPEQAQVVMRCLFEKKSDGSLTRFSEKRPYTYLSVKEISAHEYSTEISMKGVTVRDWLPNHFLRACSFTLMVLGRETRTNKALIVDLNQLGDMWGPMNEEELKRMQDKTWATQVILKQWNPLKLEVDYTKEVPEVLRVE